ncbi:sialoadhesin-like isoform X2 [Boleophthalmus pectinirostris]|uniref:sialoadhesin-like isoform X2 n=1 Tax=Boleophthalmus pectinirostris TaxID=150288 RepID=UPI00243058F6|nr:sialoadhesin-like isoform X2 [Boleophthalmus pectinirostris]
MLIQIIQLLLLFSGADCCDPKNALFITTPSPMEALSGSCLWIPCTYKPASPYDINTANPVTGIWLKHNTDLNNRFSVSGDPSKSYPMNITGNLKNKNCTTMFYDLSKIHEDDYYFRVENIDFNAFAACDPLQITVRDSPWSPTVKVSGKQTETEVVTITCSAVTPCPHAPPQLTWDLHQDTVHITENNTDGTFTTKITQNITLTDAHDGLMIKCKASYPVSGGFNMADSNVTLSVSYGPKNTSVGVSPSGSLSAGQSVTLSCSSRAKPPVHLFTWFRHSSQGPVNVSQGHTYSFNFTEEGQYYCVASNTLGNESSPDITLSTTAVRSDL